MKIRSQLDIKRKMGDFIGAFAVYGYRKDPKNKNKLLVDRKAAQVVELIFRLRLQGMSNTTIAEKLNKEHGLSITPKIDASSLKRNEKASKLAWFFIKLFGC